MSRRWPAAQFCAPSTRLQSVASSRRSAPRAAAPTTSLLWAPPHLNPHTAPCNCLCVGRPRAAAPILPCCSSKRSESSPSDQNVRSSHQSLPCFSSPLLPVRLPSCYLSAVPHEGPPHTTQTREYCRRSADARAASVEHRCAPCRIHIHRAAPHRRYVNVAAEPGEKGNADARPLPPKPLGARPNCRIARPAAPPAARHTITRTPARPGAQSFGCRAWQSRDRPSHSGPARQRAGWRRL